MKEKSLALMSIGMGMLCSLLFSGCAYYIPQVGHIPLMSQRGELVAEAGIGPAAMDAYVLASEGASDCPWFYQAACAYAPTDHLALQLSSRKYADTRHQIMAGYYTPLGENAVVEVYGGYAYAKCSDRDREDGEWSRYGNAQTFFVQGDIGIPSVRPSWDKKTAYSIAFGLRAGGLWLDYMEDRRLYVWDEEHLDGQWVPQPTKQHNVTGFELQPMLQVGIGGDRFKIEWAIGYSWTVFPNGQNLGFFPASCNLSLTYRIPLKKRNSPTP